MDQLTSSSRTLTLSPELSQKLKTHTDNLLLNIIDNNRACRYVRESPVMNDFHLRLETAREDSSKLDAFRTALPLTDYKSYEPFVSLFFQEPRRESQLTDVFAPGLPHAIAISSSTSGAVPKYFPKYTEYDSRLSTNDPTVTMCSIYSMCTRDVFQIEDNDAHVVKKIPVCGISAVVMRARLGVSDVELVMDATFPCATSIVAIYFIPKYRPFLLMHALFALRDRRLQVIQTSFATVVQDIIRYMEEEWDTLLDSIEHGKIPEYDDIEHVREYLQRRMLPDPQRAAELRAIGFASDGPGWLKKIWPGLRVVSCIVGGIFAAAIPKLRYYIGPDVRLRSLSLGCTEAFVGAVYDDNELNMFKATTQDVVEYLDIATGEDISNLIPAWEVEPGKMYEVVLTTRDGLWRYRLGDIIRVVGFSPEDGLPLLEYIERKTIVIRFGDVAVGEKELVGAISSTSDTLGHVVEFTVVKDYRKLPPTFGYIVEIVGSPGPNAHLAVQQVLDHLSSSNIHVQKSLAVDNLRPPTIRIVEPGTFRDFRTWRIEELNGGAGQVKVPVVLTSPEAEERLLGKVVLEL